jgi:hypothetical protein|eukprot:COSAG06_NODE_81_length_25302_cov_21.168902_6_plen_128_part_00
MDLTAGPSHAHSAPSCGWGCGAELRGGPAGSLLPARVRLSRCGVAAGRPSLGLEGIRASTTCTCHLHSCAPCSTKPLRCSELVAWRLLICFVSTWLVLLLKLSARAPCSTKPMRCSAGSTTPRHALL